MLLRLHLNSNNKTHRYKIGNEEADSIKALTIFVWISWLLFLPKPSILSIYISSFRKNTPHIEFKWFVNNECINTYRILISLLLQLSVLIQLLIFRRMSHILLFDRKLMKKPSSIYSHIKSKKSASSRWCLILQFQNFTNLKLLWK